MLLIILFFVISILYAAYIEKVHRDRVLARQRKQMEESISFKATSSSKVAPESGIMRRSENKDEKFFEMLATDSGGRQYGTLRWWDCNFMEQEMEDAYRKVRFFQGLTPSCPLSL